MQVTRDAGTLPDLVPDSDDEDAVNPTPVKWPSYASLIVGPSGKVNLTAQNLEIRLTVRKAVYLMHSNLCFVSFYPTAAMHGAWTRNTLISAARALKMSLGRKSAETKNHYRNIQKRVKSDDEFAWALGKLVSGPDIGYWNC